MSSRFVRSAAFVLLAVAMTVAIAMLGSGNDEAPGRVAAAPPATPIATAAARLKVRDPGVSVQDATDFANGVPGVAGELYPLKPGAFAGPIAAYRRYALERVARLRREAAALTAALRAGNRARARATWNAADSSFTRIGAAYGALGGLGDAIDGGPGGLPQGARDQHFTGLQRIERGLWTATPPRALLPFATRLQRDVARLRHALRASEITPLDYATRAHEILEDAQRDRLGERQGADEGVRAVADGVAATNFVMRTLRPVLGGRGDAPYQAEYWLRELGATLSAIRRDHGGDYPTVAALSMRERETLNGRLGATLEALAGVPGSLETVKHSPLPRIPG
ncbi:MAG: high-affinity iron transporter [Solirubrobacteraceae bacterium]|nr:high-affinity iron transporter [Solirubrobacteraceae bacterium]